MYWEETKWDGQRTMEAPKKAYKTKVPRNDFSFFLTPRTWHWEETRGDSGEWELPTGKQGMITWSVMDAALWITY